MTANDVVIVVQIGAVLRQALVSIVAALCIYFGYRLFYLTESTGGDFEASSKWGRVRLSKAAPGIFFTLFGCIVLLGVIFGRGAEYTSAKALGPDGYLADKGLITLPDDQAKMSMEVAKSLAVISADGLK